MNEGLTIPKYNNFYGIIFDSQPSVNFANQLKSRDWNCRKSSWTEFEAAISWAELEIIEEGNDLIIIGAIDSDYFEILSNLMNEIDCQFKLELYNEQKELIKTSINTL